MPGSIRFYQLPLVVRIAVGLVFNNAWWSIEEFVINRLGLWKYMPYYKATNACIWDLVVGVVTVLAIWRASMASTSLVSDDCGKDRHGVPAHDAVMY